MNVGDIVTRKSYNNDIFFIIESIYGNHAVLSGLDYRLTADTNIDDLELIHDITTSKYMYPIDFAKEEGNIVSASNRGIINDFFKWHSSSNKNNPENALCKDDPACRPDYSEFKSNCFVKILHIDANEEYLKECLKQYRKFNVQVIGISIKEEKQPMSILGLLTKHRPNILVITGHDSICKDKSPSNDINHYLNSKYFVESIKIARNYNSNYDELVIIAGGCNSCYEALIEAGANFASSPSRVLISITEPVNIACIMATTSIQKIVSMDHIAPELPSGTEGFGGVETRGQCRLITPGL
ncbi:MAG: sporulation peptidase YabG [Lachnospiraceae bacterium]|nr:sporulation peptidase YabG [Lachnospiraceae bacterium]